MQVDEVIERIAVLWPNAFPNPTAVQAWNGEFRKALRSFEGPTLEGGWARCMASRTVQTWPKPGEIASACREIATERRVALPQASESNLSNRPRDRAKHRVEEMLATLKTHWGVTQLRTAPARFEALRCLKERAYVQAQVLENPPPIGIAYDGLAFGYGTWGPRNPDDMKKLLHREIDETKQRGMIDVALPQSAIDWFVRLDRRGEDQPQINSPRLRPMAPPLSPADHERNYRETMAAMEAAGLTKGDTHVHQG